MSPRSSTSAPATTVRRPKVAWRGTTRRSAWSGRSPTRSCPRVTRARSASRSTCDARRSATRETLGREMSVVLLVGGDGQLAHDLRRCWEVGRSDDRLVCLAHADLEVADLEAVEKAMVRYGPSLVINTSAYHRVDEAERQPERSFLVNALGPRNLAVVC